MKKTVSFSIVALIGLVAIAATMKISDYPAKTFLTGTELFLLADGTTNAKMTATSLNAALTNVAGLRVGATIRTANGAALTNLTFTNLLSSDNVWSGSNYFPVVSFGVVTADSNVMNFASAVVMSDSASNLVAWNTNLAYASGLTTEIVTNALGGAPIITNATMVPVTVTVATLPGSPVAGQRVWVSDVVTSRGVGDFCYYNGTAWKTMEHVTPTTDIPTFIYNAFGAGLSVRNTITSSDFDSEGFVPVSGSFSGSSYSRASGVTSPGTLSNAGAPNAFGNWMAFSTVGGATSDIRTYGIAVPAVSANNYFATYGAFYFTAACSAAETYWASVGMDIGTGANYPTRGAFFVYDMFTNKVVSAAIATSTDGLTNQWICATAHGSSYTYVASGLTPSTSATAPDRLAVILTNGAALFYTNGALCQTIATTLPADVIQLNRAIMVKTNGTTARVLYQSASGYHIRHPARNYP